ncbi:hypothetical protein [Microvirga sp. TS319]|uniref:hypothetical protein n=1 Tax=Microvirga sp. TS319 TaxID=3241165 RepID=UPI00351A8ED5
MSDLVAQLDIHHEVIGSTQPDVAAAMGQYTRFGTGFEDVDDGGDPPAFAQSSHRDFPLDFESVLGIYDADTRRVTCFTKGIAFVATALGVNPFLIERIVRYHEFAHAHHHLGIKANASPSEAAGLVRMGDEAYRRCLDETKEQIAQLATLIVIRQRRDKARAPEAQRILDRMLETFFDLMARQSSRYRLPPETRDGDLSRLHAKLGLLIDMTDAGMSPSADHIRRILA